MRNPDRLDGFYNEIKKLHKERVPDWRFGQLLINFFTWMNGIKGRDPFFPEEDRMLELFKEFLDAEIYC